MAALKSEQIQRKKPDVTMLDLLVNEIKYSGVLGRRRPKVVPFYFQVQNYNLLISMLSFNESMIHFQRQFIMAKTRLCNYITKRNINQQMEGL